MNLITSRHNPKYKQIIKLRERKTRESEQLFIIEGYREILRAIQSDYPIKSLFVCPKLFLGTNEKELISKIEEKNIFELDEALFEKASYRDRPDGLIAVAPMHKKSLKDLKLSDNPLIVVCESIEKPGNLGSILRSSDAAGVDAVIVCDRKTDIFNPNVVRASIGTLFSVPTVESSQSEVFEFLKKNNISMVATTPHSDKFYTESDLSRSVALLMGTEQLGLSEFWMEKADIQVKIPMHGIADSLNVASATTLVLYEARRQMSLCQI